MTIWAVYLQSTGALVAQVMCDTHPRFNGFDWQSGVHAATALASGGDPAVQAWNPVTKNWEDDIPVLRARHWMAVRDARDRAEWWGCSTALGRVDTDPDSQRKISGAVQMAMIAQAAGAAFSIDWTMQSNATATHDGAAMISMGVAVGQHVAACHAVALTKRAAIEAAADVAAIGAIDVDGGWPDAP